MSTAGNEGKVAPVQPRASGLRIAVFGGGCIGSMLAWHLVRNGKHEVTVVARGARLAQLQADKAILTASGDRAEVLVSAGLDTAVPYDLLLVPVKGNQVAKVLPDLRASAARAVMFMSVTFGSLHPMREAVGPGRFAYGFPKFPAIMKEGRLKDVKMRGPTIVTEARWAQLFNDAGIPSSVTPCDMDSYLRAHVAAATPILTLSYLAHTRGSGLSWAEARTHAQAQTEGFAIVRHLGLSIPRAGFSWMNSTPQALNAFVLWLLSRVLPASFTELLASGADEAGANIDEMNAAAPGKASALLAIRPPK